MSKLRYDNPFQRSGGNLLNQTGHHHTAAITYTVDLNRYAEIDEGKVTEVSSELYASVWISDCSRSITLNFDVNDRFSTKEFGSEKENALEKVDRMIQNLQAFKLDMLEAFKIQQEFLSEMKGLEQQVKKTTDLEEFKQSIEHES